uniref:Uncharacterized protein n=1 Tax=Anguilla anguilla TaxID=7936 RepID=A0A0E9RGH5_ANGAN
MCPCNRKPVEPHESGSYFSINANMGASFHKCGIKIKKSVNKLDHVPVINE